MTVKATTRTRQPVLSFSLNIRVHLWNIATGTHIDKTDPGTHPSVCSLEFPTRDTIHLGRVPPPCDGCHRIDAKDDIDCGTNVPGVCMQPYLERYRTVVLSSRRTGRLCNAKLGDHTVGSTSTACFVICQNAFVVASVVRLMNHRDARSVISGNLDNVRSLKSLSSINWCGFAAGSETFDLIQFSFFLSLHHTHSPPC